MKNTLTILALLIGTTAFAGIKPSEKEMDFGIAAGALNAKVSKIKSGKFTYNVIAVDLAEPACNSTQIVVWMDDDAIEGDAGGVGYNLGLQLSHVTSVKAKGKGVVIQYKHNNPEDCTKSETKTVEIEYPGAAGELSLK